MILEPGAFKVGEFRKAIPTWVKLQVLLNQWHSGAGIYFGPSMDGVLDSRKLRFDHRPTLEERQYDTQAGDFIPPQNDPAHIQAITTEAHDHRTFGRRPGAEKTVTTKGSDAGNAALVRSVKDAEAVHKAKVLSKNGDYQGAAAILATARPRARKPKQKIQSRGFAEQSRSFPKRTA